jgi:hypothetical protein
MKISLRVIIDAIINRRPFLPPFWRSSHLTTLDYLAKQRTYQASHCTLQNADKQLQAFKLSKKHQKLVFHSTCHLPVTAQMAVTHTTPKPRPHVAPKT